MYIREACIFIAVVNELSCHSLEMILHISSGLGGQIECAGNELEYTAF